MRKTTTLGVALVALCASLASFGQARAASCGGAGASSRGEWPLYGHDLSNRRNQPDETAIGAQNAGSLAPKWSFSVAAAGGTGNFQSTPTVDGGCVFIDTDGGSIFALDANSGALVWQSSVPIGGQAAGGPGMVVSNGLVYGDSVDPNGPFIFALHESDGTLAWKSDSLKDLGTSISATPQVFDGMVVVGVWGNDPDPAAFNGYAIVDAATGQTIQHDFVIPEADRAQGWAGGGIWGTFAIDTATKAGYVGTANPYSKTKEHQNTNALLKVDLDRTSATFGQVVGSYKGTPDNYIGGPAYDNPTCAALGPQQTSYATAGCFQLDLDFGASPSLWSDANGRNVVGDMQKACVFHAADAHSMSAIWQQQVATTYALGCAGTSTVTGNLVVASANPGIVWAFDKTSGAIAWATPTADGARYEAMSSANGVVYTIDGDGGLDVIDASSGVLLAHKIVASDAGSSGAPSPGIGTSAGPSIAEGKVFAPAGGFLVAYGE